MHLDHEGVIGRLDGPQHVAAQDSADLDKATFRAQALPHVAAKRLLDAKDADYKEIYLTGDDAGREALLKRANGMRTVPQIFINDKHIGGYDNLAELEEKGELDKLLSA